MVHLPWTYRTGLCHYLPAYRAPPTTIQAFHLWTQINVELLIKAMSEGMSYAEYAPQQTIIKEGKTTGPQKEAYVNYTKLGAARLKTEKMYTPSETFCKPLPPEFKPASSSWYSARLGVAMRLITCLSSPNGQRPWALNCG